MKITIAKNSINPHYLMTKAGYNAHYNDSYVMRLSGGDYPRFHVYINENNNGDMVLNLHLDQTKAVNKWMKHAHRGEGDSDVVKQEHDRLVKWINYFKQ
ncbi:MAG: hypothetical protein V1898_02160 [Patescibacteria group bacterium]